LPVDVAGWHKKSPVCRLGHVPRNNFNGNQRIT
jgi:hypothetical protein